MDESVSTQDVDALDRDVALKAGIPTRAVELRMRLCDGKLPMYERHLKALKNYGLGGPMQSWLRTRMEYVLENHAPTHPDGVLHMTATPDGKVLFEVEPQGEAPVLSVDDCVVEEGVVSGVRVYAEPAQIDLSPLWIADSQAKTLVVGAEELVFASCTTLKDLARTIGWTVDIRPVRQDQVAQDAFVVTDEFGVLPVVEGPAYQVFAPLMARLWQKRD